MNGEALDGRILADRYRIVAPLARGGMARVFRARDERLERDVAVKVLSPPYADDPAFVDQFLAEARAAGSLSHPSLVHVYDSGSDGDAHYIVMELLDQHRSLKELLESDGPLPAERVLAIGRELLAGLRVVHARGLVHCDVKSGNVMLGPGPAKLIDFGIARPPNQALAGDTSIGSLPYMSPEQLHGEALTGASDLFSLGVVLYEALTGRQPYVGRTPEEIDAAHLAGAVQRPSELVGGLPGRLDDAILQALRREPASRFGSAEAMDRALESVVEQVPTPSAPANEADETRVIARAELRAPRPAMGAGYVPPAAPPEPPVPRPRSVASAPRPRRGGSPGRRPWLARSAGSLVILAAVAVVLVLVAQLLIGQGNGGSDGSPSASAQPTASAVPGRVTVPDLVGRSTPDAIAAAQQAGLNWTVQCAEDPDRPEGIIGQEPAAGTTVPPGSRFTMFSARISDCR